MVSWRSYTSSFENSAHWILASQTIKQIDTRCTKSKPNTFRMGQNSRSLRHPCISDFESTRTNFRIVLLSFLTGDYRDCNNRSPRLSVFPESLNNCKSCESWSVIFWYPEAIYDSRHANPIKPSWLTRSLQGWFQMMRSDKLANERHVTLAWQMQEKPRPTTRPK